MKFMEGVVHYGHSQTCAQASQPTSYTNMTFCFLCNSELNWLPASKNILICNIKKCWHKNLLKYQFFTRKKSQERKVAEDFGQSKFGRLRKFLWNMTEYPETSKAAQVSIFQNFTSKYNFIWWIRDIYMNDVTSLVILLL